MAPWAGVRRSQHAATERTPSLRICGDFADSAAFRPGNREKVSGFHRLDRLQKKIASASVPRPRPGPRISLFLFREESHHWRPRNPLTEPGSTIRFDPFCGSERLACHRVMTSSFRDFASPTSCFLKNNMVILTTFGFPAQLSGYGNGHAKRFEPDRPPDPSR